jgi:hypothetical protein
MAMHRTAGGGRVRGRERCSVVGVHLSVLRFGSAGRRRTPATPVDGSSCHVSCHRPDGERPGVSLDGWRAGELHQRCTAYLGPPRRAARLRLPRTCCKDIGVLCSARQLEPGLHSDAEISASDVDDATLADRIRSSVGSLESSSRCHAGRRHRGEGCCDPARRSTRPPDRRPGRDRGGCGRWGAGGPVPPDPTPEPDPQPARATDELQAAGAAPELAIGPGLDRDRTGDRRKQQI